MAETIKEFLVGLSWKVDGASERKFTDAIRSATLQADLLARGIEGAAKAIAKAVADISAGFESIFYTAQRANTSVGNLRAMTYALSQLGTSAGSAQASLSNFGRRLATDPGAESMLKAIGVRTRDAAGRLRDTTKLFEEFGRATQRMPAYVALGYAQQLGVDEDTMRAMREQPDLLARLRREQAEYARSIGLNQDEAAEKGKAFMQSLRRLEMVVTLVSQKILSDLAPALQEFIDKIIEWVRQNPDAIRDGLVQIGTAATEFAKALLEIAKAIAPVIVKIGEMAGAITGHSGLQGVMEAFAAFMVASWAVRLVAAISSVNTAWGLMALRLGLPILIGSVAMGHGFQTPEQAAKDPDQAILQQEGIDRRARVREWFGERWGSVKRMFGGGGAEAAEGAGSGGGRGGAGIRRRAARAAEADKTNYNFTGENADVLRQAAKELGTSPRDLATVISYESGFNPRKWGGKGGNYMGLIQFGPEERRMYGANDKQTFAEQMPAVVRYLKSRKFKPGMGLMDLYSTINAGSPGLYDRSDGYGTVRSHTAKMIATHTARAERFLASGSKDAPDLAGAAKGLDKLMTEQDRAAAAQAEAARAEAAKVTAALTQAQRDALDRMKRDKWNEVYKATGDATKADAAMRQVGQPDTRGPDPAMPKASAGAKPPAAADAAIAPRRPTFAPAIDPKPLGSGGTTDNSRSASLTQHNTFHVQASEPRQTAELVLQGQKSAGQFGLAGIQTALR